MSNAPNSRAKKFVIWFVIAMIVLFIVMDFIDRTNAKKGKNSYYYEPTVDLSIRRNV
jgi:predicted secreted protein